jgi:hypothetical protein
MDQVIECVGDPRAMGNGQGLACRSAIQERVSRNGGRVGRPMFPSLRALTSGDALGRGTGREIIRHYTHLAERMAGMARHADVGFDALMRVFCDTTDRRAAPSEELLAAATAIGACEVEEARGANVVLRTLASTSKSGSQWIVRKSRPEVGFASAEVTLPWLASAVAGVNQSGLAVAIAPRSGALESGAQAGAVNAQGAPHASLLVQECLQRFEDVAACLDWCSKRPCAGNASLIISDANGRLAAVQVVGTGCEIVEGAGGFLAEGPEEQIISGLAGHYRDKRSIDLATIAGLESSDDLMVWLEPQSRSLSVRPISGGGAVVASVEVDF